MEEKLEEYGLNIRWSDSPNRELIDFSIEDTQDNIAWVWGKTLDDVEVECNHPYQCIEFGDIEEQGVCLLCGSYCDWHYEEDDEGNKVPEAHEWYPRRNVGGLIEEYLRESEERQK